MLIRLWQNYKDLWAKYHWVILIFYFSLLCDACSTIYFMLKYGQDSEIHPAIYFVSKIFGPIAKPLIGAVAKAMAGILIATYCKRFAVYIFLLVSIISLGATWYNIYGVEIHIQNILK
jgi:hypothetical protein